MTEPAVTEQDPAQSLPAYWYHDASVYEREKQMIFANEWLLYGHEAIMPGPGSYLAQSIAGWPLLVIRGKDGVLRGFHNVCRHRASMVLPEGVDQTAALRCMYHGWIYDSDGRLKKAPGFGGDEEGLCARTGLFPVHVKCWKGLVFVCMADKPPSFEETLGELKEAAQDTGLEGFSFHSTARHSIACNWKTYVENYAEGYHIPAVHPGLDREIDFSSYKVVTGKRLARHLSEPRAESRKEAVNDGLWLWLWPYAALNIYRNGMNLELMAPTGPETMELHYFFLFRDLSEEKGNNDAIAMSKVVTVEDIEICEIVQKNLRAGIYESGPLSPRHENGVAWFQDLVRQATGNQDLKRVT